MRGLLPATAALAQDHLAAEVEAEAAVADPADEGVDRAAAFEADDDALAEARLERRFDHRAGAGDVDHRHRIFGAAKNQGGVRDEPFVTRLRALFDEPWLCLRRHVCCL